MDSPGPPRRTAATGSHRLPLYFLRTASLDEIPRPGFCSRLILSAKHRLDKGLRADLSRQISAATRERENLREQGKLKRVIALIFQYALHTLQRDQGILTDAPTIHNIVTEHFTEWYRAPGPPVEHSYQRTVPRSRHTQIRNVSVPPHAATLGGVYPTAATHDSATSGKPSPPFLAEFKAAIHHHKGSTAPGATGLTYNMVKERPDPIHVRKIVRLCEVPPTDSTLLVHLNCFEHAWFTNTPLYLFRWDVRRAFDSRGDGR